MLRILIILSVLFAHVATYAASPKGFYGYIGAGIGPQSIVYTDQERQIVSDVVFDQYKQKIKETLHTNSSDKAQWTSKTEFKDFIEQKQELKAKYEAFFLKEWTIALTGAFRVGGGYQWSDWISIEAGYNPLYSQITNRHHEGMAFQQVLDSFKESDKFAKPDKRFLLHGIQLIGKGRIPLNKKWGMFVQIGGGLYRGTIDRFDTHPVVREYERFEKILRKGGFGKWTDGVEKLCIRHHLHFPLAPALITGGGARYTFSAKKVVELGWTHIRIAGMRPLNLGTVNLLLF